MGCLFVVLATLLVATGVLILWLLGELLGGAAVGGPLSHLARGAGIVLLLAVIVGLAGGLRFGRRLVGPIGALVEAAGRIEAGDFSARVPPLLRGPRDLRALTTAFNTMAARLETEEATRRRLLADLGHELRTPIAVIEGHLEAIVDGVYPADAAHLDPILDETRVLERLVDDLRTVSLAEAGSLPLHREPVDLGHLVAEAVAALTPKRVADRHVTSDVDAGLPELELDPVRMRQVLGNLLDNALRYTPAGGTVTVAAHRAAAGSAGVAAGGAAGGATVELSVTDAGPGLAPEVRDTLFDRFAKSPDSPGSGLGLAIARAIAEAHGGSIRAEAASPHGTRIVVTLPMAAPGS
jgi:signal transduction histidine kinase